MTPGHRSIVSVGLDVGSISVKVAVLDAGGAVVYDRYIRHNGRPVEQAAAAMAKVLESYPTARLSESP